MTIPGTTGSDTNPYNPDGALTDTSGMQIPHSLFRGEFGSAPKNVRAQTPGDTAKAKVIADQLGYLIDGLTAHHQAEDELLWPLLHQRLGADDAFQATVTLMEDQHHAIHEALGATREATLAWAADPSAERRDALADALEQSNATLFEHLQTEETQMLPVVARTVSKQEWDAVGDHAMDSLPKDRKLLTLGAIHYYAPKELWPEVAAGIPWILRPFLVRQADRAFREAALAVHGTATP